MTFFLERTVMSVYMANRVCVSWDSAEDTCKPSSSWYENELQVHQRLLLYPEDAGSTFLRNITAYLQNCMAWFWKTLVFGIRTYFLLSGTCRVWCIPRDLLVLVLEPTAILMEVIQLFETAVWRRGWGLWLPPELFSTKWRRVNFWLCRESNPSSAVFQSVSWSLTSKQK